MQLFRYMGAAVLALAVGDVLAGFEGSVGPLIGWRGMHDRTYWDTLEDQFALGVQASFFSSEAPLGAEASIQMAVDSAEISGITVTSTLVEASVGLRYDPARGPVRPYLGGGIAGILASVENESGATVSDDDGSSGYYGHAGLLFPIARHGFMGIDFRVVRGTEIELFGVEGDADYEQLTLHGGYAWGSGR